MFFMFTFETFFSLPNGLQCPPLFNVYLISQVNVGLPLWLFLWGEGAA